MSVRADKSAVTHRKQKSHEHTALLHTIRIGNSHFFESYCTPVVSSIFVMWELFGHNLTLNMLLQDERFATPCGLICTRYHS